MRLHPKFDCATCLPSQKIIRGCKKTPTYPLRLGTEPQKRCPLRPFKDDPGTYHSLFRHYSWFSQGHLPDPGSWLDQTERFVEAMEVIRSAHAEADDIEHQQHEAERKRKPPATGG